MKLDGISAFVATIEAGSISGAARRLGLAKSVVSERLVELERTLGARLVQRTTRRLSLTSDGESFLPRARRILAEVAEAAAEITERSGSIAGPLRLSAPVSFGVLHLSTAICAFLADHPEIDLTLDLDDRFVDVAADGYDAVIRHGPVLDTRLVARRLAVTRRTLVAAPAYLERSGTPRSPADLQAHCGILYSNRDGDWRFSGEAGWTVVRPRSCLRVNNGLFMRHATLAGHGIALLPTFFTYEDVAAGRLVQIDIGSQAEGAELFLCYPLQRTSSARVHALYESLRRQIGDPPCWDA
ncbi:LysR family transcriptional regulator (plasmid) [Paroceanicella profunda]|uniref:LysR family transcriptional regulator n=1 Tax=Paroceanicella profunda TaxID=2579971 RepID=A0A5B8FK19_9RHOB|nr:LysR family transcriptional regulator [Paroceanicella profunda]QDL94958.1 LysR family transcriptional regulator [Paroceanicella profunda]